LNPPLPPASDPAPTYGVKLELLKLSLNQKFIGTKKKSKTN